NVPRLLVRGVTGQIRLHQPRNGKGRRLRFRRLHLLGGWPRVYALGDPIQTSTRPIPCLREAHGRILTDGETVDAPIAMPYDGPRLAPLRGHAERESALTFIKHLDAAGSRR